MSPLPLPEADSDEPRGGGSAQKLVRLTLAAAAIAVVAYVWYLVSSSPGQRLEPTQEVVLLDPEELLPELEPPEEVDLPEPEPEESVEIESMEEMDPLADDLPDIMDDALGLDAAGSAGSDAFGLKAKRGGRSLLETGDGSGDPMSRFAGYAAGLERSLRRVLGNLPPLVESTYAVEVKLWIDDRGLIERCELYRTTGNAVLDDDIVSAINQGGVLVERPPSDLPQPVLIRVKATPKA